MYNLYLLSHISYLYNFTVFVWAYMLNGLLVLAYSWVVLFHWAMGASDLGTLSTILTPTSNFAINIEFYLSRGLWLS